MLLKIKAAKIEILVPPYELMKAKDLHWKNARSLLMYENASVGR